MATYITPYFYVSSTVKQTNQYIDFLYVCIYMYVYICVFQILFNGLMNYFSRMQIFVTYKYILYSLSFYCSFIVLQITDMAQK